MDLRRTRCKGPVREVTTERSEERGFSRTIVSFDRDGRLLKRIHVDPDGSKRTVVFRYDAEGNLTEPELLREEALQRDDGSRTVIRSLPPLKEACCPAAPEVPDVMCPTRGASRAETNYDSRGFLTETVFYDDTGAVTMRVEFKTDAKGNVTEVIRFSGTKPLLPPHLRDGMRQSDRQKFRAFIEPGSLEWRTSFRYDDQGRVIERADYMAGDIFTWRRTYTYNEHGDVATETTEDPRHGSSTARIEYDYDAHGNWIRKVVYHSAGSYEIRRKITYYEE